jgi:hypothetical protein
MGAPLLQEITLMDKGVPQNFTELGPFHIDKSNIR